jgi:hypothetical protein
MYKKILDNHNPIFKLILVQWKFCQITLEYIVSQVFLIHIYDLVLSDLPFVSQDILLEKWVQLET